MVDVPDAVAVPMETPTVAGVVPARVTVAGVKVQASPVGSPEQEKVTGPLKPLEPVRVSMRLPACPVATLSVVAEDWKVKSPVEPAGDPTVTAATTPSFSLLMPAAM